MEISDTWKETGPIPIPYTPIERKVYHFSNLETYILLDADDRACMLLVPTLKNDVDKLIAHHHDPTVQEMRAMAEDMHGDFEKLMQSIELESAGVRISL